MKRAVRVLGMVLAGVVVLYAIAVAGLYAAMRQTPDRFGAIMAYVPMPAMMVLPFRPLWMSARAGDLKVGDPAPDFELRRLEGGGMVKLSEECRQRPVTLIFGSYT